MVPDHYKIVNNIQIHIIKFGTFLLSSLEKIIALVTFWIFSCHSQVYIITVHLLMLMHFHFYINENDNMYLS